MAGGNRTSWPWFTSVAENLNLGRPRTNPASGRAGLEPGTAGLQVQRADHSATHPDSVFPIAAQGWETVRYLDHNGGTMGEKNWFLLKMLVVMWPKECPYPRNTGGKWKHDALTKTSAWESSLSGLEAEPMSRYLLPFKNAKTCLQSLSISKNNGLVSVFKTIFRHWNCFLSAVVSDGRDGHGLKL